MLFDGDVRDFLEEQLHVCQKARLRPFDWERLGDRLTITTTSRNQQALSDISLLIGYARFRYLETVEIALQLYDEVEELTKMIDLLVKAIEDRYEVDGNHNLEVAVIQANRAKYQAKANIRRL
jgi:hypothetical protein